MIHQLVEPTPEIIALGNDNERMIEANLWSYWAHLSIYRFAVPFCVGKNVLEAGCGVGYGAAYLAKRGAFVRAHDASIDSILHAQNSYNQPGLSYSVADLNDRLPAEDETFDVVFSSNVFEHVPEVNFLAAECARVVKSNGVVLVAVPPVTTASIAQSDVRNHHHVHHLPPAAWHAKLSRFFEDIQCHGHQGSGHWRDPEVQKAEISRWINDVTIRETDFEFPEVNLPELNGWQCITAVFVCRRPRLTALPETLEERTPSSWNEGAIAARVIGEERAACERLKLDYDQQIERLRRQVSVLNNEVALWQRSTSWRLTEPARYLVTKFRAFRRQRV